MNQFATADAIVTLCGAASVCAAMVTVWQRDPHGSLTTRLVFALGIIAALFFARGMGWWFDLAVLHGLSVILAAFVPLGALVVMEGITRRHAPRLLKAYAALGAVGFGLVAAWGLSQFSTLYFGLLAAFQLTGLGACAILLALSARGDLPSLESHNIRRLSVAALVALPFLATDYEVLGLDSPVRLGALGAQIAIGIALVASDAVETKRQALALMAVRLGGAALLGAGAAQLTPGATLHDAAPFIAIAVSGVLAIGAAIDATRAQLQSGSPGLLGSLATSAAATRGEVLWELSRHRIFAGAKRHSEVSLGEYDPPILRSVLRGGLVLRRHGAPWGRTMTDPAVERILSLMKATGASHLIVLAQAPLDIVTLTIPVTSADPATETAINMAARLLVLSPDHG